MATLTVSAELTAPPALLWDLLGRFDRYPEWLPVHDSFTRAPDWPPVAGGGFVQCATLLGVAGELHWVLDQVEPPRRLALSAQITAGARLRTFLDLEPRGTGTLATCRHEVTGSRAAGVMMRVARAEAHRQTLASLTALGRLAAQHPAPGEERETTA